MRLLPSSSVADFGIRNVKNHRGQLREELADPMGRVNFWNHACQQSLRLSKIKTRRRAEPRVDRTSPRARSCSFSFEGTGTKIVPRTEASRSGRQIRARFGSKAAFPLASDIPQFHLLQVSFSHARWNFIFFCARPPVSHLHYATQKAG